MRSLTFTIIAVLSLSLMSIASAQTVEELEAENMQLRQALAQVTQRQMKELGLLAHYYAQEHDRFPEKPSDLREIVGKHHHDAGILMAPYALPKPGDFPADEGEDAVWAWLDENSSFVFHAIALDGDATDVLIEEREPVLPGHRVTTYRDGHVGIVSTEE